MNQRTSLRGGFTLIELLIVIVILGLLLSLVAPTMFSKVSTSQRKTALAQMQMLATSLDTYRLDLGDYPPNLAELGRPVSPSRHPARPLGPPLPVPGPR
jgi:general secretion pathway protein G